MGVAKKGELIMLNTSTAPKRTRSSTPAIKRETLLAEGGIVSMKVPRDAREGMFPSPTSDGDWRYLQFAQGVKGGVVFIYIHCTEPGHLRGIRVTGQVEIIEKTLGDGRRFLHVNILSVNLCKPPTHRLAVMSESDVILEEGFVSFKTPAPLEGMIVLAPLGRKIRKTTD
jgi:hypothetical protein